MESSFSSSFIVTRKMFMSEIFLLFLGTYAVFLCKWFCFVEFLIQVHTLTCWVLGSTERAAQSCLGTPLNNPAVKFSLSLLEVDGVKFCNYYFLPEITPLLWWWNPVLMMTGRCYTIYTNLLLVPPLGLFGVLKLVMCLL